MRSHLSDKERRGSDWGRSKRDRHDRRDGDEGHGFEFRGGSNHSHHNHRPQHANRPLVSNLPRTEISSHAVIGGIYRPNPTVAGKIDVLVLPYTYKYNTPYAKRTIRFFAGSQKSIKHGPLETLDRELGEELVDPKKGTIKFAQEPEIIWTMLKEDEKNPRGYHAKILFLTQIDRHDVFRQYDKIDDSNPAKLELLEPPYWQDIGEVVRDFCEGGENVSTTAHIEAARRVLDKLSKDVNVCRAYADVLARYCSDVVTEKPNQMVKNYLDLFKPTTPV